MDTRAKILHEALNLFAAYGYDGVGVQLIVESAGITKPTLYHYFGNKRGLFETLVKEYTIPLMDTVREASYYTGDITLSIQKVMEAYFTFAENHSTLYRMLISMWFAPPSSEYFAVIQEVQYKQYQLLEALFKNAEQHHGNMRGRQAQLAVSLKGTIDTYIGMALQGYVNLHAGGLEYRVMHQFMHGIFS